MARYQKCKHFKGKIGEIGPTYWLDISIVLNVTDGGVSSIYALEVHPPLGSNWEFLCIPQLLPGLRRLT